MSSGANDRRGIVQRLRDARRTYRGPFNGTHVKEVVCGAGYLPINEGETGAFLMCKKDGCKVVPINTDWEQIWDDDPTFRCLARDLGLSRGELRTRLNQARMADD